MFGGVLLFQNFSASYTSFLAVTTEYKPFDSLQDLLENTDYSIGTPKGYATKEMFQVLIAVKEDIYYVGDIYKSLHLSSQ